MGGCVSANDDDTKKPVDMAEAKKIAEAKTQRRRLSMAPTLVGDTSGDKTSPAAEEEKAEAKVEGGCTFLTQKGYVPYNKGKVNQDNYDIKSPLGDDDGVALYAAMDGHGQLGHLVSGFVKRHLAKSILAEGPRANPEKAIMAGVKNVVDKLARENMDTKFSGTTLVFVLQVDQTLYCGNIGDSRCVLKCGDKVIPLSQDQKPDNPGEKERILRAGGRVQPLPGPPGEDMGPDRVWLADVDIPGLAMSRSIGDDISRTVGVISVPEIMIHKMTGEEKYMILASDGVWEFIESAEACDIVDSLVAEDKLDEACEKLVAESTRRWQAEEEVIDDITCVIKKFY